MQKQTCSWILVALTGPKLTAREIVKVLDALLHPEILRDHSSHRMLLKGNESAGKVTTISFVTLL